MYMFYVMACEGTCIVNNTAYVCLTAASVVLAAGSKVLMQSAQDLLPIADMFCAWVFCSAYALCIMCKQLCLDNSSQFSHALLL